jgi:parallel beta-helix repeat protein
LLYIRFNPVEVKAPNDYPVHNLNTGLSYTTIQKAIDAPETENGHTIFVEEGIYSEHVIVSKSLSLIGENRSATIIDGSSIGNGMYISAHNVNVTNFTIRNAGTTWGGGFPNSCILVANVMNVNIENNTLTDGAVGILGYASSNITMCTNLVYNYGLMGIHLDGNSAYCKIINNTVKNCLEGIELERSADNLVEGNQLAYNNVSIVVNQCSGLNVFRRNNMSSDWYNIIVWGWSLEAFMQDMDTSNIANNRTVYYLTNFHNLMINTSSYPNLGYLAAVNCTNITIKDIDISHNKDGLLVAQSTNCTLVNITLSGNLGPLLHGGLTFFKSNNNLIVNNKILNNSVGVCLYQSNNNVFYHNSFVNNNRLVISNFHSPFSEPTGSHSINKWDNDAEGNFWSDYNGTDSNGDGIGDSPYIIDANNQDRYPLMEPWTPPIDPTPLSYLEGVITAIVIVAVIGIATYLIRIRKKAKTAIYQL